MAQDATGTPTSPDLIPTFNTAVDAPSGKGFNAAMAQIQTALSKRLAAPAGIISGEAAIWNGSAWVRSSVTGLTPSGIAGYPADATKVLRGDGTWGSGAGLIGAELDYFQITTAPAGVVALTEATAPTLIGTGFINTVTVTIATPGVFTTPASHNLSANDQVMFQTTGALPTGLSTGTNYFVIATGLTATTFQISATQGGVAINTSGTQSGTHSLYKFSVAYDGTRNKIEFFSPSTSISVAATSTWTFILVRDGTIIGQFKQNTPSSTGLNTAYGVAFDTPSAANHAYFLKAFVSANTGTFNAGAGGSGNLVPAFLRVTRA